jgi:cell division protein FtsB
MKKQQEEIERLKSERITLAEEIADIRRKLEFLIKERCKE